MKLKKVTTSEYMKVDGYQIARYDNVEVPDNFDDLDATDQIDYLFMNYTATDRGFEIRKILYYDPLEGVVDYET